MNEEKEKKKKKRLLLLLLLLLLIAAVCVSVWAIWFHEKPVLAPDYAPAQTEKNAEAIGDDSDEKLEQPEGGGAVALTYAKEVSISLSENEALLLFANPTKSNQDMVLQLVIDDVLILQSDKIEPGTMVTKLSLQEGAKKRLKEGGYEGKFIVSYYDEASGEKAVVNTEIPVTVTVSE